MSTDTIAAIASPAGGAERAIVRISGPRAEELVRAALGALPAPLARGVHAGRFRDARGSQPVALWWMPAPRSYTREDVAELHLSGAAPLVEAAFARLLELGARAAGPGEFTRRAFENGRIDLAQAEGVLELVRATSEAERRAGLGLLEGGLAQRTLAVRAALEELRALCEASLDFDESDTGHVPVAELVALAELARARLADALSWEVRRAGRGARARVLLAGLPNAGKSSLFNALGRGAQALVSAASGTTRDWLAAPWALEAGEVLLVDTPGLCAQAGEPERRARELADREIAAADLLLWVAAADAPAESAATSLQGFRGLPEGAPRLVVWNRIDRPGAQSSPPAAWGLAPGDWLAASALTGPGSPSSAGAPPRCSPRSARPPSRARRATSAARSARATAARSRTRPPSSRARSPRRPTARRSTTWPRACAPRRTRSIGSPGARRPTTCSSASSRASASGNEPRPRPAAGRRDASGRAPHGRP